MAHLLMGCIAGLAMAAVALTNGGGILAVLLAYSLGGAGATVLLVCAAALARPCASLPPRQLEAPVKRLA